MRRDERAPARPEITTVDGRQYVVLASQRPEPEGNAGNPTAAGASQGTPRKDKAAVGDGAEGRPSLSRPPETPRTRRGSKRVPSTFQFVVDGLLAVVFEHGTAAKAGTARDEDRAAKDASEFRRYLEATHTGFALRFLTETTMMYNFFPSVLLRKDTHEGGRCTQPSAAAKW